MSNYQVPLNQVSTPNHETSVTTFEYKFRLQGQSVSATINGKEYVFQGTASQIKSQILATMDYEQYLYIQGNPDVGNTMQQRIDYLQSEIDNLLSNIDYSNMYNAILGV